MLRRLAGLALIVSVLAAALVSRSAIRVRAIDRNGDGLPDLWQYYDARGTLIAVETDTDFDGRADTETLFADGRPIFSHALGDRSAPAVSCRTVPLRVSPVVGDASWSAAAAAVVLRRADETIQIAWLRRAVFTPSHPLTTRAPRGPPILARIS